MYLYTLDIYTKKWKVGAHIDGNFREVRSFKNEIQAITFVNYLNGGTQDVILIAELLEQTDKA